MRSKLVSPTKTVNLVSCLEEAVSGREQAGKVSGAPKGIPDIAGGAVEQA